SHFATYLIANSTVEQFLRHNPENRPGRRPHAYFSLVAANPDHFRHVRQTAPGVLAMEDLWAGGERDFHDAVPRLPFQVLPGGGGGGGSGGAGGGRGGGGRDKPAGGRG